ncbi:MAG: cytochrome c-type biogenesis protein CcmH [Alphaproteobacteria bacterium]|nr:cytochrome c-type biogenesis protein CcmH [Alphaproteobacteria bacterium]
MNWRAALIAAFLIALPVTSWAAVDRPLEDATLEARALKLNQEIRCLVCQGQSVADSNADLAYDLRQLVRERVAAGDSDAVVLDYLHARYGDFVLLEPPVKPATYALWFGPPVLLVIGGVAVLLFHRHNRKRNAATPTPLNEAERRALDVLLKDDGP